MPARTHARDATPYEISLLPARRDVIRRAWRGAEGRAGAAALALGLSRSQLYREIGRVWGAEPAERIAADLPGYAGTAPPR